MSSGSRSNGIPEGLRSTADEQKAFFRGLAFAYYHAAELLNDVSDGVQVKSVQAKLLRADRDAMDASRHFEMLSFY